MSDSHHLLTTDHHAQAVGEVDHEVQLAFDIGSLYLSEDYSDIQLIVNGLKFSAHKVILATRSDYFRAMLYGGLKESHSTEISLNVNSVDAFKQLLRYVYTSRLSLSSLKEDLVLDILGLSHQYGFTQLEAAISEYLRQSLTIRNVCLFYDAANLYNLNNLANECCTFIDRHAWDVMHHDSFLNLSPAALKEMISRDSFCAQEVDIFRAVCEWAKSNLTAEQDEVLAQVRLPLMSQPEMLDVVRPTGLVSADVILDAIKVRIESRDADLKYRGYLMKEENVASPRHGAQVLQGELKTHLLDGDVCNYDMEKGFTRHHIDDSNGQGILIKLGMQCIINHMKMLLWDKDMRAYSYYIEVSMDQKDWHEVIDHRHYHCRSWQNLYFPNRVVKFIRIVGTHNTVNRVFHLVSFECMYTDKPFELERGLLIPRFNVASIGNSACVIEGVSRSRNALINGDYTNYDWETGYTCHQLGSGAIVVQLSQPYLVDSMRLLLWDVDSRAYSYYVEVSSDQSIWHLVGDKRNESCRSWQIIRFPKRPVVFIRIIGTHNTANEVFHCVHFECPAHVLPICEEAKESDSENSSSSETKIVI
ncbi:BTB/POZ domain-containing protein 9 [Halotydeus destructor]|nr:BTB/POZ domain-containing protein 9 [Halotydeus destructor]